MRAPTALECVCVGAAVEEAGRDAQVGELIAKAGDHRDDVDPAALCGGHQVAGARRLSGEIEGHRTASSGRPDGLRAGDKVIALVLADGRAVPAPY